jgi:hypothetical protein
MRAPSIEKSILPDASFSKTTDSERLNRPRSGRESNRLAILAVKACGGLRFFHYNNAVSKNVGRACWGSEKF